MSEEWQQAVSWIEQEFGGRVTNARAQGRWRDAWFFDLEQEARTLPLYFRGHRPGLARDARRLMLEIRVLQVLEKHGLPVPHVYGFCPEPEGIVMEYKPGRPGISDIEGKENQLKVLDQYVDALAAMHKIDVSEFAGTNLPCPQSSEERGLADLAYWEGIYRKYKFRPEPLIEFAILWLKNNIPPDRNKTVFLHVDSGQFIYHENELTAMLDFELSMLGDPMADLAGLRTRNLSEPLVDLSHAYKRYQEKSGEPIDWYALDYHTVRFALMTPVPIAALVAFPPARVNLPQYLGWYYAYSWLAVAVMAQLGKVEPREPRLPDYAAARQRSSDFTPSYQALHRHLESLHQEAGAPDLQYDLDIAQRLSEYLERVGVMGRQIEDANRADLERILGKSIDDWQAAQQELEELVLAEHENRKAEMIEYFYRYTRRHLHLMGPVLRELEAYRLDLGRF
ncbi:MAG: phosphotransferase family protein [Dehalococcoidia bacterium]